MGKLLDKFYDYTIQDNSGFKIAIGDLVVSVACHNYIDAYDEMNGNGIAGSNISIEKNAKWFEGIYFLWEQYWCCCI